MRNVASIFPLPCIIRSEEGNAVNDDDSPPPLEHGALAPPALTSSSELVMISSKRWHKQIRYGATRLSGGFLSGFGMSSNKGFDEVWVFHESNDGKEEVYISPLSEETKKCLSCDYEGKIHMQTRSATINKDCDKKKIASSSTPRTRSEEHMQQIWKVTKAPEGYEGVVITNISGRYYLSTDGEKVQTSDGFAPFAVWDLQRAHQDNYTMTIVENANDYPDTDKNNLICRLLSYNEKDDLLVAFNPNEDSGRLITTSVWTVEKLPNKEFFLCYQASSKKYLAAAPCDQDDNTENGYHTNVILSTFSGENCYWEMEFNERDDILLKHVNSGKYLMIRSLSSTTHSKQKEEQKENVACLVAYKPIATGLSLSPAIPEYKPLVPRPVKMIGLGIAAPFAVTGAVSALGFSSAGIAAGSIGARLMSISAIASGGGVPAGGLVATLQSIGAAGLGVFGTTVSVATGVAAGSVTNSNEDVDKNTASSSSGQNNYTRKRVFSEWIYW